MSGWYVVKCAVCGFEEKRYRNVKKCRKCRNDVQRVVKSPRPGRWKMSNYEICQVCGGVHYGTCCPSGIKQAMEKVSDEILHEIVEFSGDRIMPLIASELILARQQLEAMKWVPVGERLPEAKQSVLVIVKHRQRHIEKACYIPPKTVLAEDFLSDEFDCEDAEEYDEENDCYWVKEGWWEDSWEADNNWKMSGEVTHWMPLPVQPEEG